MKGFPKGGSVRPLALKASAPVPDRSSERFPLHPGTNHRPDEPNSRGRAVRTGFPKPRSHRVWVWPISKDRAASPPGTRRKIPLLDEIFRPREREEGETENREYLHQPLAGNNLLPDRPPSHADSLRNFSSGGARAPRPGRRSPPSGEWPRTVPARRSTECCLHCR